jgi:hypothetical protein
MDIYRWWSGRGYYILMGSRGANPGISKRRPFGRLLPGHPSRLWMTQVAYALSPWSARRIVEGERWIRATRAHTEVKRHVKVERGSVWGSGMRVDDAVHHKVLIIKAIAEPRRSMPGIRGDAGVVGHQRKGACHRAGIPLIPGLIDRDVEDAVERLRDRARYHAGRWRPDVKRRDGILKGHRAMQRAVSIGRRCAG